MPDVNAGTIYARLAAKDELTPAIKRAKEETRTAAASMQRDFSAVRDSVRGVGTALLAVSAAGLGASAGLAKLAMEVEQSEQAFTTLLKTGTAAKEMLSDLREFAKTTPFEFRDLERGARRLLAFKFAANDVLPILRDVGNAAAAMGGDPEVAARMIRALGQIRAAGRLTAEEVNQLTEVGIPAWDFLARAIGRTTAEVRDLTTKGLIPANTAIEAIRRGVQDDWGDAMARQAKTTAGELTNLKDQAYAVAVAFGQHLKPAAKEVIGSARELLEVLDSLGDEQKGALAQLMAGGAVMAGAVGGFALLSTAMLTAADNAAKLRVALNAVAASQAFRALALGVSRAGPLLAAGGAAYVVDQMLGQGAMNPSGGMTGIKAAGEAQRAADARAAQGFAPNARFTLEGGKLSQVPTGPMTPLQAMQALRVGPDGRLTGAGSTAGSLASQLGKGTPAARPARRPLPIGAGKPKAPRAGRRKAARQPEPIIYGDMRPSAEEWFALRDQASWQAYQEQQALEIEMQRYADVQASTIRAERQGSRAAAEARTWQAYQEQQALEIEMQRYADEQAATIRAEREARLRQGGQLASEVGALWQGGRNLFGLARGTARAAGGALASGGRQWWETVRENAAAEAQRARRQQWESTWGAVGAGLSSPYRGGLRDWVGIAAQDARSEAFGPWWQRFTGRLGIGGRRMQGALAAIDLFTGERPGGVQGVLSGALSGATAGSAFGGPVGATIGGAVGGIMGLFGRGGRDRAADEAARIMREQLSVLQSIRNALQPVSDYFRSPGLNALPAAGAFGPTAYAVETSRLAR